jgi:hypothetical protein
MYETLRSSRWSADEKTVAMFLIGATLSVPFVICQVLWLATGKGPIQWLYRPGTAFVDPLPRWSPDDPKGALERFVAAGWERYGDVPVVQLRPRPPRR